MVEVKMSVRCDRCGKEAESVIPAHDRGEVDKVAYCHMKALGFHGFGDDGVLCDACNRAYMDRFGELSAEFNKKCDALDAEFKGGGK